MALRTQENELDVSQKTERDLRTTYSSRGVQEDIS